ncbi:MAG TPA: DUF494 family protein [bacterium]|nr:DUF494 family protein [bacterium]HNT64916.1 DUF494 family protein [bacterium]HOX84917.1 DUF494 family protein [bacterium]HPG44217.1 DUF494 family protein [bacterium]HPM96584.1 DUF494 family protein [bacterium]
MNKNILRILAHILQEMKSPDFDDTDLQTITEMLMDRGFSEEEVMQAISWLDELEEDDYHAIDQDDFLHLPRPIWRQMNALEKDIISPSAFSYLFRLRESGMIADAEMERIIDRATRLDLQQVNVEEMKDLVAVVLLDVEKNASDGYFQFFVNQQPH